jgi:hypothetical protein
MPYRLALGSVSQLASLQVQVRSRALWLHSLRRSGRAHRRTASETAIVVVVVVVVGGARGGRSQPRVDQVELPIGEAKRKRGAVPAKHARDGAVVGV